MKKLKEQIREMDFERSILVPVFLFLLILCAYHASSLIRSSGLTDFKTTLVIAHSVLLICFYLLTIALFFKRHMSIASCRSLTPKVLAYAGTFAPFLLIFVRSPEVRPTLALLSLFIMTTGMLFSLYSLKTLGVSFGIMPQVRTLIQNGPYKFIRHPLYVGEIVSFGGAILTGFSLQKLSLFLVVVAIQSYRAVQEEKLLDATLPEYSAYMASTKRFIPGLL